MPNGICGESPLHALRWLARAFATSHKSTKLREWLHRYGLAECGGLAGAVLGSYLTRHATGTAIAAAYGAAWGETIGYACTIVTRDFIGEARLVRSARRPLRFADLGRLITGLLVEFGPAGALDTFVTRPAAMALGTRALGLPVGVIVGKVTADVLFYVPVIIVYEHRQRSRQQEEQKREHQVGEAVRRQHPAHAESRVSEAVEPQHIDDRHVHGRGE